MLGILVLASMSIAAHSLAYFPGDVSISHAVQARSSGWLDEALVDVSWLGFPPQSDILFGAIVSLLFVFGARWAALTEAIAAIGSGAVYLLLEHVVAQPRPSADLVRVVGPIQMTGYPSGHLVTFVAVFGFLAFVCYRRLALSRFRFVPVALVVVLIAVMGFARIYAGHHWASDVVAGVLVGTLWLVIAIRMYCWKTPRTVRASDTLGQCESLAQPPSWSAVYPCHNVAARQGVTSTEGAASNRHTNVRDRRNSCC